MAFDRSRYKSDGRLIFEDKIDETGNLQKAPTFQLPDFADGSDAYANNFDTVLSFENVREGGKKVFFKAFITAFNETYSPNFNSTEVFGRTDPIQQYKNTTRNITLAWKLPAASESEAYENLGRAQSLIQMLYPTYLNVDSALTLSQAPLVRLKVMNLVNGFIPDPLDGKPDQRTNEQIYNSYTLISAMRGLLGVITSCTINHNLEGSDGVFQHSRGTILPKLIDINISFTPLHEETLGYDAEKSIAMFPYGVQFGQAGSQGRQDNPWLKDQQLIGQVQRGQTLSELRKVKEDLEKKRRQAASDQQNADRQAASARRAQRRLDRMNRRGSNNDTRRDRLQGTVNEQAGYQSDFEAAVPDIQAAESLIGSNSTY
jgi:hypothetical protein